MAPEGKHTYHVLFPTPNLRAGLDWNRLRPEYHDQVATTLERNGYHGFGSAIEVEKVATAVDWARRGMAAGTPFAAAHNLLQTR